jgi:hypothetical protein
VRAIADGKLVRLSPLAAVGPLRGSPAEMGRNGIPRPSGQSDWRNPSCGRTTVILGLL